MQAWSRLVNALRCIGGASLLVRDEHVLLSLNHVDVGVLAVVGGRHVGICLGFDKGVSVLKDRLRNAGEERWRGSAEGEIGG